MRWLYHFAVFLLTALIGVDSASSQNDNNYEIVGAGSQWIIDTNIAAIPVSVKKGKTVAEFKIYPKELFVFEIDAVDASSGQIVASSQEQLVKHFLSDNSIVFCRSRDSGFLGKGIFRCFVDRDGDGKLESYYHVLSRLLSGTPILDSGKIGGYSAVKPAVIRSIDRKNFDNPMKISLVWKMGDGFQSWIGCKTYISSLTGSKLELEGTTGLNKGQIPGAFYFLNLKIAVASKMSKIVDVKIERFGEDIEMTTKGRDLRFRMIEKGS